MTVVDSGLARIGTPASREQPPSMVERVTRILEAFESGPARLALEEVTIRSGLPRSTVHRILEQLVRLDWIDHGPFGYRLGSRAVSLGGDTTRDRLREGAAPYLHELAVQTGAVVHLEVLDGTCTYCLDKLGGPQSATVPTRVGGRVPAYATAAGKAILATFDPEHVDGLYGARMTPCTRHTVTDRVALHHELNRIRKRHGIAFDREEAMDGVASVAAPLRSARVPAAAVSLAGDARTFRLDWTAPLVADYARRISQALGAGSGIAGSGM